tara:strand:+ start:1111 stop:1758 length:648 start_codon:yes stop_codon:yes gene_type:complete
MIKKLLIPLFILSLSVLVYKSDYLSYPIDEVEIVSTSSNYNSNNINSIVDSIQGSDLLSLDLNILKNKIISDGWIKDVEIRKSFPSKIEIVIIPQEPYAIYNSQILMKDGSVVKSTALPKNLTIIVDKTNNHNDSLDILMLCNAMLVKIDLTIKKIEIHDLLVKINTSSNVLISDRENLEVNLRRLVVSFVNLQRLFKKDIKSIDMRYSNGFAIK